MYTDGVLSTQIFPERTELTYTLQAIVEKFGCLLGLEWQKESKLLIDTVCFRRIISTASCALKKYLVESFACDI